MSRLSLDDFEWVETGFDRHDFTHKDRDFTIACITHYNGWHVRVLFDETSQRYSSDPLIVDTLDAAKAVVAIIANQHMETYHERYKDYAFRKRIKRDGPPPLRSGVFKVG